MNSNWNHRQADKEEAGKEKLKPVETETFGQGLTKAPNTSKIGKWIRKHRYLSKRYFLYEYYYIVKCALFQV